MGLVTAEPCAPVAPNISFSLFSGIEYEGGELSSASNICAVRICWGVGPLYGGCSVERVVYEIDEVEGEVGDGVSAATDRRCPLNGC